MIGTEISAGAIRGQLRDVSCLVGVDRPALISFPFLTILRSQGQVIGGILHGPGIIKNCHGRRDAKQDG